ncbi:MAG: alkaline phosphatase family protein [Myxococcales bacterium]|nr:alkaline phosphatase family protein [Myxococcales bacterium]
MGGPSKRAPTRQRAAAEPQTTLSPPNTGAHTAVLVAAVGILIIGIAAATWAGVLGSHFMNDLENPRPALSKLPVVASTPTQRRSQRVVVAIVDGLRLDVSRELPFLTELRGRGVDGAAASQYPTWSLPNYVNILTGVPPSASGVRTNRYGISVPLDSIMDRVRAQGLRSGFSSDNTPLTMLFLDPRSATRNIAPALSTSISPLADATRAASAAAPPPSADEAPPASDGDELGIGAMPRNDDLLDDRDVTYEAAQRALLSPTAGDFDVPMYVPWPGGFRDGAELLMSQRLDLIVLLIGVVDVAGHERGGSSVDYRAAAYIADEALRQIAAQLDFSRDAMIVVADHGHTAPGGHGGLEPDVVQVPFIAVGAGIVPGAKVEGVQLQDVAPTLGALLGVGAPQHALGRTLIEMLDIDAATKDALMQQDTQRIRRNREIVMREQAHAAAANHETRSGRLLAIGAVALVILFLGGLAIRAGGMRLRWRALAVSLPAFFVVYFTLLGALGQHMSPSFLPARGHISAELLKFAVIGCVVQILFNWIALRKHHGLAERLSAANGIAWVGLLLTLVPVAILWAYFPPPYTIVPSPTMLVLVPALQIALATYVVGTTITLLGEIVVYWARQGYRRRLA